MKIKFRLITIVLVLALLFSQSLLLGAEASSEININIDDENVVFSKNLGYPFINKNNRTLVPFRVTLEKFGARISWDSESNAAMAKKNGITVKVPIGKNYILIDEIKSEIDSPAIISEGRTYLPIRAVLEAFGAEVDWDRQTKTVVVKSTDISKIVTVDPVCYEGNSEDLVIEILPRVELLSGVLSQTSWMHTRGPYGKGNNYFRDLQRFFSAYKDHEAIIIAEELTKMGFIFDAPLTFILSLGEIPILAKDTSYSDYLIRRGGGEDNLEKFRIALADLAVESGFEKFFELHRTDYKQYIEKSVKGVDFDKIIKWIEDFYGWRGNEFHIVFAPAMFPGGGYGPEIIKPNGDKIFYQVVREGGGSESEPEFNLGENYLEDLTIHEWSHSYVNPTFGPFIELMEEGYLFELFKPVEAKMNNMAYGHVGTFYNEQIIRAITCIALEDLYGIDIKSSSMLEKSQGFYLTDYTIELLKHYKQNRDKFKTFKDFAPILLKKYSDY